MKSNLDNLNDKKLNLNNKESIINFIHMCILKQWILNISFEKCLEKELSKEIPRDKNYNNILRKLYNIYKKNGKTFWQIKTPVTPNNASSKEEYASCNFENIEIDGKVYEDKLLKIIMPFNTFKNLVQFIANYGKISQYDAMKKICSNLNIKSFDYLKALKKPNIYVVERIENLSQKNIIRGNIHNFISDSIQRKQRENNIKQNKSISYYLNRNINSYNIRNNNIEVLSFLNKNARKDAEKILNSNIFFRIVKNE